MRVAISLWLAGLVAMTAGPLAAGAEARAALLSGKPRVETVRVFIPREGRDAGRVIVWVRVNHVRGTRRALARERPETIHTGRVVARIGSTSRFATRRLDLDRRRMPVGYHLRFPRSAIQGSAAQADRRVRVAVRVAQTVDLQSDGERDDSALTSTAQSVPLGSPQLSIEPGDGYFVNGAGDELQVSAGHIVSYFFFSGTSSPCGNGPANVLSAPIDPQTGQFSFTSTLPDPPTSVSARGTFTDADDMTLDASISTGSCVYNVVPTAFSFTLYGD